MSGALALLVGTIGMRALLLMYPGNNPFRLGDTTTAIPRIGTGGPAVTVDWRVFAFTIAASVVTGVICGFGPALHASRVDLVAAMKRGVGGRGGRHSRVGATLVVAEVALALMLLVGAGLLNRTSMALRAVDAGFDAHNVVTMRTSVTATRFETRAGIAQLTHEGASQIRAVPGVVAVAAACCKPLGTGWQLPVFVSGPPTGAVTKTSRLPFSRL